MVILFTILVALVFYFLKTSICEAHCDTMDGPVVQAAQKALETKNINLILIWIPPENETEIQDIFQKTLNIRELSPEVRELADRLFFETLVRLHRAGEGAPFTGLKPAGSKSSPAIIQASMGITLYALFIALLIPEVKKFYPAAIIAGIGGLTHSFLTWLKVFSPGWNIIIAIFSAAILGALLMGKDEEEVQ
jgi:hypothetical protein